MDKEEKYIMTFQNQLTPEEADKEKALETKLGKALIEAEESLRKLKDEIK